MKPLAAGFLSVPFLFAIQGLASAATYCCAKSDGTSCSWNLGDSCPAQNVVHPVLCCDGTADGSACTWSATSSCPNPTKSGITIAIPSASQVGGATVQLVTQAPFHGACFAKWSNWTHFIWAAPESCVAILPTGGMTQLPGGWGLFMAGDAVNGSQAGQPKQLQVCFLGGRKAPLPGDGRYGLIYGSPTGPNAFVGYVCDTANALPGAPFAVRLLSAVPDVLIPPPI
jgi:hypothetical protein